MRKSSGYVMREAFIVERIRGRRVLDLGFLGETCEETSVRVEAFECSLHWKITHSARETVGIDYATEVVDLIRKRYPRLQLIAGNVYKSADLLAAEPLFETVVLGDILEHLSNPGLALDGILSVLMPDGELIVTCPNAFGLPNYVRFVTGRFRESEDHALSFNKHTLTHLLERHGFKVGSVCTCLDRTPSQVPAAFRLAVKTLEHMPEFGGTLLLTANPVEA